MKIAYSPCPNDTFLFYAWVMGIVGKELSVEADLHDIQELNAHLKAGTYDLTKASAVTALGSEEYQVLSVGSAMGFGCGPLLICKESFSLEELKNKKVGIPGKDTVAHLLFHSLLPKPASKHFMLYHEIEPAIERGEIDCGVVIHETRFTYKERGFSLLSDIGALWEQKFNLPLPLGVLAVKKSLGEEVHAQIEEIVSQSIEFSFKNPEKTVEYMLEHSMEKDPEILKKHLELYVNQESLNRSDKGREALRTLHNLAIENEFFTDHLCHAC